MAAVLPPDFLWGFATASFQIEGASNQDGRGTSVWDEYCKQPGRILDGSSGATACDSYNRTFEDIELLKSYCAKAYRFSISWSRIIPLGGRGDPVNQKGLDHYVKFVDDLVAAGITPIVTLYHWDLPHALNTRYGGLLNKAEFVADFGNYASTVFEALPKVKHWITFNEPWVVSILGYNIGTHAPGETGNQSTDCWIVGHNLLVAHGTVVQMYRRQFRARCGGEIGLTLNGDWGEPFDASDPADVEACERQLHFRLGWFADPVYFGKYPDSMRRQLGARLPEFSVEEALLVQGSNDFYGLNHYSTSYVRHREGAAALEDYAGNVELLAEDVEDNAIGPRTQMPHFYVHAPGFGRLLRWITARYDRPKIYVTENGTSVRGESEMSLEQVVQDDFRAAYFCDYIGEMAKAVSEHNCDVRAYLAWSLLDNFEWAEGYTVRFGVTHIDYENGQRRTPKRSARVVGELFAKLIRDD